MNFFRKKKIATVFIYKYTSASITKKQQQTNQELKHSLKILLLKCCYVIRHETESCSGMQIQNHIRAW